MTGIIENRAWFLHDDHKFPVRVYVMSDQEHNSLCNSDLKMGKILEISKDTIFRFNVEKTKKATLDFLLSWDFLPNSTGAMLVNEKASKILHEIAEGEFQAIPTIITMYDGVIINNYHIINITTKKKLINEQESVLLPEEQQRSWSRYKTCYYNKDCLGNSNLARADHSTIYMCSEKFRQAVLKAKLKGLAFDESYAGEDFFIDQ